MKSESLEETNAKSILGGVQSLIPKDQKVLGVRWNISTDSLIFSVKEIAAIARSDVPTKKGVMSTVGKFYDPLGLYHPLP